MSNQPFDQGAAGTAQFLNLGKERTQDMVDLQKQLLETYEQASRNWLARMKSEMELWSDLAKKLSESRSAPEVMEAYQQWASLRMQMAMEDGRRIAEDCQTIVGKVTQTMSAAGPLGRG